MKHSENKKNKLTKSIKLLAVSALAVTSFTAGTLYMEHQNMNVTYKMQEQTLTKVIPTSTKATQEKQEALSIVDITNLAADTVVEIRTESVATNRYLGQYVTQGAGSGVIIRSDGYIVTNNHVIEGANKISVTLRNGKSYTGKLIGSDSQTDLAVIKIEASNLKVASLGDSDTLQTGELAVAIGNPLGQLGGTVTDGIISATDREITLDGKTMNLLQTSAAINPGNSGGGLFDGQGKLIGIVVAKSSGSDIEGIGFAIPVNEVKSVIDALINVGYVQNRPALGIKTLELTSLQQAMQYGLNSQGVYIAGFSEKGKAKEAGLEIGDAILAIEKTQISCNSDISKVLAKYKVGDKVTLTLSRDGQLIQKKVTLSELQPETTSKSEG